MLATSRDMLELSHLTCRFGSVTAVNDVSLSIPRGQMVGIIGRSGAGKSTLLRMINRLQEPTEGTIRHDGVVVSTLRGKGLRDWRTRCAMIFQQFNLVNRLDVLTNVLVGRLNHRPALSSLLRMFTPAERAMAIQLLDRFDLADTALQRADTLSGGQQQRVAIARALALRPELILFDEVTSALDPEMVGEVLTVIRDLVQEGLTCVLVTHEMRFAQEVSDAVYFTEAGRIVESGPPPRIFGSPQSERTRAFLQRSAGAAIRPAHSDPIAQYLTFDPLRLAV